jgi:hypothetical protein
MTADSLLRIGRAIATKLLASELTCLTFWLLLRKGNAT